MATEAPPQTGLPTHWTIADLQRHLGDVAADRIRIHPPLGMAIVDDVIQIAAHENRHFELVDGVLVEKTMGWYESMLAGLIVHFLHSFLKDHNLGKVLTTDGTLQILPDMVRIPDVCFIGWDRFPNRQLPIYEPIPSLVPDLAIEVLSKNNTDAEMQRKLKDYFEAGVRLVWYIDPPTKSARAFATEADVTAIPSDGVLSGGGVLPGFELSLTELFAEADRQAPPE